jgi:uncharacterized surface protein with fasciclin (FAS1) repeats
MPQAGVPRARQPRPDMSRPFRMNIVDTAVANGSFRTFCQVLDEAGMSDLLKDSGPYTMFAPTDAAFDRLPEGVLEFWQRPENKPKLLAVLRYHISPGRSYVQDIGELGEVRTLAGQPAPVALDHEGLRIAGASFTQADMESRNGVIHGIDQVMLPKG